MLTRERKISHGSVDFVAWWLLVLIVGALAMAVYGLFHWASGDPAIDENFAREQFREERDWRCARRAGEPQAAAGARERLQNVR